MLIHCAALAALAVVTGGSVPDECAVLYSTQPQDGDILGRSASVSGTTAMIGGHQLGNGGPGLLCVFDRVNGVWVPMQKLLPNDVGDGDQFGGSVSMSGSRALIGARLHNSEAPWAGAAYVYERLGSDWVQTAKLTASDAAKNDYFGYSLSLDGNDAIVGAYGAGPTTGAAYLFEYSGATWTEVAKLIGPPLSFYGREVAIGSGVAVVGAPQDGAGGRILIYEKVSGSWVLSTEVRGSNTEPGDDFGWSVSASNGRVLVGAPFADGATSGSGAGYVFEKQVGGWVETQVLRPLDGQSSDLFGWNVRVLNDRILVGTPGATGAEPVAGAAYLFEHDGASWTEMARLSHSSGVTGENFGNSVALGETFVVVSAAHDSTQGDQAGAAVVYCGLEKAALVGSPFSVSLASGGDHKLSIDFGSGLGSAFYWVLGSTSGTDPGVTLGGGIFLPLNPDAYTTMTLTNPHSAFFENYVGFLAADGTGAAVLELPSGLNPAFAGVTVSHSVVVSTDLVTFAAASNPASVLLVP